jgi:hypothetical protein
MPQSRQLSFPGYLVAFALMLLPLMDALLQVLPIRIHEARWRFGTFGLMSNALLIPLFGIWFALALAAYFDHRRFQRVLAFVCFVTAVVALGLLAIFALDALQVRSQVRGAPAQFAFNVASVVATFKCLLATLGLVALGIAGLRGPKPAGNPKSGSTGGLVMGTKPVAPRTSRSASETSSSTSTM